jgi:hypothetical protein
MQWASIMILLLLVGLTFGQGNNPFDIQSDETAVEPIETEPVIDPAAIDLDNPFSINPIVVVPTQQAPETISPKHSDARFSMLTMIVSLLSLIIIAFGISSNRLRFQKSLQSIVNASQLKGLKRTDKTYFNIQNILLYIAFVLNLSLFLYMIGDRFIEVPFELDWYYVLAGVILIYVVRHTVQQMIGFTFPFSTASNLHNYSLMIHNSILGVILLPLLIGLQFGPESFEGVFIYIGISAVILTYVIRQAKGTLFALNITGFSIIYFFIYLCAVEIAPVLILLRDLSG